MPQCPFCGKLVEWLVLAMSVVDQYPFYVKNGFTVLAEEPIASTPVDVIKEYDCPHCLRPLASTEEQAKKFLTEGAQAKADVPYLR